jgi:thymidylate kinase
MVQNFNSQTTVISSNWKLKCQKEKSELTDELHQKCTDENKTMKQDLKEKHDNKERESQQKINELYLDLQREEEKLLQTIDALNHSNEQGDTLQKRIDEMLN